MFVKLDDLIQKSKNMIPFKFTMRVIGAYGLIQVFAQDIGIATGCDQARFMHNIYVQIVVFTCAAYAVTDDFVQSFLGTMIYFFMKYAMSESKTNNVCFPDEKEIKKCGTTK